ncbi:MAG: glycosyl transferase family 2, partial [Bacteroidota bacterium]
MMTSEIVGYIFLFAYVAALTYVTFYCLMSFHLLYHYKKFHRNNNEKESREKINDQELPFVTVQLPIFNELYVIERLIEKVC